jgi:hypothetical protein
MRTIMFLHNLLGIFNVLKTHIKFQGKLVEKHCSRLNCKNFINILRAAFTCTDPGSAKKTVESAVFLRFWDQRVGKMLMKLTPVVNFNNIKRTNFLYKRRFSSFYYVHVTRKKLPKWRSYKKFVRFYVDEIDTWKFWRIYSMIPVVSCNGVKVNPAAQINGHGVVDLKWRHTFK